LKKVLKHKGFFTFTHPVIVVTRIPSSFSQLWLNLFRTLLL